MISNDFISFIFINYFDQIFNDKMNQLNFVDNKLNAFGFFPELCIAFFSEYVICLYFAKLNMFDYKFVNINKRAITL